MELRKFGVEQYKGYAEVAEIELAPLTILVGSNNSGKTALAQAIQLIAGGLDPVGKDTSEPLPLEFGGIHHGSTFEDLVTARRVHGWLRLSATLASKHSELSLSVKVQNVVTPSRPSERQISTWSLKRGGNDEIVVERQGFDEDSPYGIIVSGAKKSPCRIRWRGLIPDRPTMFARWAEAQIKDLKDWAGRVRYLKCPRRLPASPFAIPERPPTSLGPNGLNTPQVLAADDGLRKSVREWYRSVFGVTVDVVSQGGYAELAVGTLAHGGNVRLGQSGQGLSHALPVVVMALTAAKAGPGVDVIEHPESELHPAAHAEVADVLLSNLVGPARPLVVETHSEMVLLRARRRIAEGRLSPKSVLIYWVHTEPQRGSVLQKIHINKTGELESWPDGVFIENYEEILAIRRAARETEG